MATPSVAYPRTVDPLLHAQAAKPSASDAANADYFRGSVAISGDTVVVGASAEDGVGYDRGAVYLFVLQPYQVHLPLVLRNRSAGEERRPGCQAASRPQARRLVKAPNVSSPCHSCRARAQSSG